MKKVLVLVLEVDADDPGKDLRKALNAFMDDNALTIESMGHDANALGCTGGDVSREYDFHFDELESVSLSSLSDLFVEWHKSLHYGNTILAWIIQIWFVNFVLRSLFLTLATTSLTMKM